MRGAAAVAAALCASPAARAGQAALLHGPTQIPEGWSETGARPDPSRKYDALITLKRGDPAALDRAFWEVSTPSHPRYAEHLSDDGAAAVSRPREHHTTAVAAWLTASGVTSWREARHGDAIRFVADGATLARLCGAPLRAYRHTASGVRADRITDGCWAPPAVVAAVDSFDGFTGFPLGPSRRGPLRGQAGSAKITPEVIREAYGITPVASSGKRNIQAITQFQAEYVSPSNLQTFCQQYANGSSCEIKKFVGANTGSQPGVESMLDTEYIMSTAPGVETWVYSVPDMDFCNDLLVFTTTVLNETERPNVISMSYGSQRINYCKNATQQRFAQDIQKMGTLGITMVIASGDNGAGLISNQGPNLFFLSPSYPSTVPYALAVGSTMYGLLETPPHGEQVATTQFGSGGGFSTNFPLQDYQASEVQAYLEKTKMPAHIPCLNATFPFKCCATPSTCPSVSFAVEGHYNLPIFKYLGGKTGRGTPDVALLGEGFQVEIGGGVEGVGGTSASTPTWAGIISLLNEERLRSSGKTLGFINPLLYSNPTALTDITKGSNGFGVALLGGLLGWHCEEGWDAVTGLGTPDFPKLLAMVKALNARDAAKSAAAR